MDRKLLLSEIKTYLHTHPYIKFLIVASLFLIYLIFSILSFGLSHGILVSLLTWAFFVFCTPVADAGVLIDFPVRYITGIKMIYSEKKGVSKFSKPEKIYLHHPNLMFSMTGGNTDIGNLRETFFLNQLSLKNEVNYPKKGDFLINKKYTFEIGGRNKSFSQIADLKDSFLAIDNLEIGFRNQIPLWLFGFLY